MYIEQPTTIGSPRILYGVTPRSPQSKFWYRPSVYHTIHQTFTTDGDEESGDSSQELVKREAVDFIARKPLHLRKKFYYVLQ